jgi:hypothetical protein
VRLTIYKPRILIIGGTREQAQFYAREAILKSEEIIRYSRYSKEQIETEDAIYIIKSARSMETVRGYRNFKEVRLYCTDKLRLGEHFWTLVFATAYDERRVKEVTI